MSWRWLAKNVRSPTTATGWVEEGSYCEKLVMPVGSGNLVTGRCGSGVKAKGVYRAVCPVRRLRRVWVVLGTKVLYSVQTVCC